MKDKISIITINLNDKIGLDKTIKSIVNQTYQVIELLVIDGASTDGSLEVLNNYKENIDYVVSEKDSGIYEAMNKGVVKSTGKYVLFLNSGDVLNSNSAIEDFVNHDKFTGDIIYGDYKFEEGEKIYPDQITPFYFLKTSLPHQSTFFKRDVFDIIGLYDESYQISSDRAFYVKCFLSNQFKFQHIKYSLTLYDLKGLSNDTKYLELKKKEDQQIFEKYYGVFYQDYLNYLALQKKISIKKRNSLKGILKRIKNRLGL